MPEIAEVRTVARKLNKELVGKRIEDVKFIYPNIIMGDKDLFKKTIVNQIIRSVDNYGKWIFISFARLLFPSTRFSCTPHKSLSIEHLQLN